jgi:hypothetical protein
MRARGSGIRTVQSIVKIFYGKKFRSSFDFIIILLFLNIKNVINMNLENKTLKIGHNSAILAA